eukprot:UN30928
MSQILERLLDEASHNVTLQVTKVPGEDAIELAGRGELQLACFMETLRREGFEMTVAPPKVKMITEEGKLKEPTEIIKIDCDYECGDELTKYLGARFADLTKHEEQTNNRLRIEFKCPSRSLIGFTQPFRKITRGTGICEREFAGYEDYRGDFRRMRSGAVSSTQGGKITGYALAKIQNK